MSLTIAVLTGLGASALLLTALMLLAPKWGWMDQPDRDRKLHATAVPPVGGLAWFVGLCCGAALLGLLQGSGLALLVSLGSLVVLGAVDDRWPLSSALRLGLQIAAVLVLVLMADVKLEDLGYLLGTHTPLGIFAIPVTVFAAVGVINAMNMVDGMDGLSGSLLLVTLGAVGFLTAPPLSTWAILAIAALLPFLAVNARSPLQSQARVFFGDCGSMSAGLLVAYLMIAGSQGAQARFAPVTALYLFALPLMDTVSLMLRRIAAGRSPFSADQQHMHHLLQRAGFGVGQTLGILTALAAVLAALGITLAYWQCPEPIMALLYLMIALAFHTLVSRALRAGSLLGRVLAERCQSMPSAT